MANQGFDDANVIGIYRAEYTERFEGSWARSVSLFNPNSDSATEEYGIFGAIGGMREWIGMRQRQTLDRKLYEVRNKPYEATLPIREVDLDRDHTGILEAYVGSFSDEAAQDHWEDGIIDLINANGICYDGFNFFSNAHAWQDSGTQTNSLTATEVPALNVGTPTAPTTEEMANIINGMAAYMLTIKNNKGRTVNGQARKFSVNVSTVPLYQAAIAAINSKELPNGADNPIVGLQKGGFQFDIRMVANLTGAATKVRMFRSDARLKPFILQEEKPIEFKMKGRDSDHFFDYAEIVLGIDARRGFGYGLWEYAAEGTLS